MDILSQQKSAQYRFHRYLVLTLYSQEIAILIRQLVVSCENLRNGRETKDIELETQVLNCFKTIVIHVKSISTQAQNDTDVENACNELLNSINSLFVVCETKVRKRRKI